MVGCGPCRAVNNLGHCVVNPQLRYCQAGTLPETTNDALIHCPGRCVTPLSSLSHLQRTLYALRFNLLTFKDLPLRCRICLD